MDRGKLKIIKRCDVWTAIFSSDNDETWVNVRCDGEYGHEGQHYHKSGTLNNPNVIYW